MRHLNHLVFSLLALGLAGCAGIGPSTVSRDRFDYTEAISDSWKHQMLLNMIKIRYGDAPVFLDVSSVIRHPARGGSERAFGDQPVPDCGPDQSGGDVQQQSMEFVAVPRGNGKLCGPADHHLLPHFGG